MDKQKILEEAFHQRDISTLRKFKDDPEVDYSFGNDLIMKTIAKENLHTNYLKILKHREECRYMDFTLFLLQNAILNQYKELLVFVKKSLSFGDIISDNQLEYNLFFETVKTNENCIIKQVADFFIYCQEPKNISKEQFNVQKNNYIKDGVIHLINNSSFDFVISKFGYIIDSDTDNFIFIRTILSLKNSPNKDKYLNFLSRKSNVFYHNKLILNHDFVNKFANSTKEINALKSCINSSLKSIKYSKNFIKDIDIYFEMTFDNNNFYSETKEQFIISLLNHEAEPEVVIKFIKKIPVFNHNILLSIFEQDYFTVFDFCFTFFNLKEKQYDHCFMSLFLNYSNPQNKNNKLFIDKLFETENYQSKPMSLYFLINVIEGNQIYLFEKILLKNPSFIDDKEKLLTLFQYCIDHGGNKFFLLFIHNKIGFNLLTIKDIKSFSYTKTLERSIDYKKILINSFNIFNF